MNNRQARKFLEAEDPFRPTTGRFSLDRAKRGMNKAQRDAFEQGRSSYHNGESNPFDADDYLHHAHNDGYTFEHDRHRANKPYREGQEADDAPPQDPPAEDDAEDSPPEDGDDGAYAPEDHLDALKQAIASGDGNDQTQQLATRMEQNLDKLDDLQTMLAKDCEDAIRHLDEISSGVQPGPDEDQDRAKPSETADDPDFTQRSQA